MSLKDAHALVKSRRPFIRPNLGFWRQLVEYENSLFGRTSVKIVPSSIGFIPDIYENEVKSMQWAKTNPVSAGTLAAANANMETNLNFVTSSNDGGGGGNQSNSKPRGAIIIGPNDKPTNGAAHMSNINLNSNLILSNMNHHGNGGKRLMHSNNAYYGTNGHGRVGQAGHLHGHAANGQSNQYNNYNAHPHHPNTHGGLRRPPPNHNNYFNGVSNSHSSNGHGGESNGSNGGINLNSLSLTDAGNNSNGSGATNSSKETSNSSKDLPRRNSKYEPTMINAVPKFSTSVPSNINILTLNNNVNANSNSIANGENNPFFSNNPKNYSKANMSLQPQHSMGQPAEIIISNKLGKPTYTTTYRSSYQKPV